MLALVPSNMVYFMVKKNTCREVFFFVEFHINDLKM